MALDGISIHALVYEFNNNLFNGKINKISQPEREELLITIIVILVSVIVGIFLGKLLYDAVI